ncbi:MAG: hypothetical protein KGP12_02805 [Actinomycetales bacterium]|nr:hypothetical protein [Actinomycetales bacterium]
MGITNRTRAGLLAATAAGTLTLAVLGGAAVANAANGPSSPTPGTSIAPSTSGDALGRSQRPAEEALTGDTAAKVQAAVEAKYPGVTIDRMEKDADGTSVYEAHITKADGTHATVMLDATYAITGEATMPGKGGHGRGGHGTGRHSRPDATQPGTASGTAA